MSVEWEKDGRSLAQVDVELVVAMMLSLCSCGHIMVHNF